MLLKKNVKVFSMVALILVSLFVILNINAATQFTTGLESGQTQPTWSNTIDFSTNVTGYLTGINPECSNRTAEQAHGGSVALMFSGTDNSTSTSYCYFKVFDVNIPVTSTMQLSYWFYPQMELARGVAIDFICTDGTTLRDSGAVDQNGISMHPGNSRGTINLWNQVVCNFGSRLAGKTIDRIDIGYDLAPSTGQFRGYIDDITISDSGSTPTPTATKTPSGVTPTATRTPSTAVTPTATKTPTQTPFPSSSIGDIIGKVIVGYQGWFDAPGDGAPANSWVHWANGSMPAPGNQNFEIYPDIREYTTLFSTGYANLGNGSPAKLFSSYTTQTVNKHFEWMQTYGIDGAAVQRFGGELADANRKAQRDSVLTKVRTASETYGRKFYVMYDTSGMGSDFGSRIETDWTNTIMGSMNLTSSSAYAKQNGKPVVCIWGMGFNDSAHPGDATTCINIINWFKNQGLYVIGGVPTYWRDCDNAHPFTPDSTATNDSKTGFQNVYKTFNMIQPWFVGRIRGTTGVRNADNYKTYIIGPDFNYCKANGMDYAPVMGPGFAWNNMHGGNSNYPKNEIPRMHGDFLWNQAYNTATLGIPCAYIAMFDEYDEGTAIAKGAENSSMIPTNQYFLTYDADGVSCSSDFYLRLTGDATKMIKGIITQTASHPTTHR